MPSSFTIDDTSPLVEYSPYSDGDKAHGWASWWSGSGYGYTRASHGDSPVGDSLHVSSLDGATMSVRFHGTSIQIYGSANCSYTVVLDNGRHEGKSDGDVLFASGQLSPGDHYLSLETRVTQPQQQLDFDYAAVTADTPPAVQKVYNATETVFEYSGSKWETAALPQVGTFRKTSEFNDHVSIVLPRGTAGVVAHGSTNYGHMLYSVSLDGDVVGTYNGSSFWLVPESVLFLRTDLDVGVEHNLTFTNAYSGGQVFSLTSVTAFIAFGGGTDSSTASSTAATPSPSRPVQTEVSKSNGTPKGVIIGVVVGVLGAVTLAIILVWWWVRRQRRRNRPHLAQTRPPSPYVEMNETEPSYASTPLVWPPATSPGPPQAGTRRKGKVAALTLPAGATHAFPGSARNTSSGPSTRLDGESVSSGDRTGSLDINNIVELIARRIDRGPVTMSEAGAPPPEYRDDHVARR